MSLVSQAVPYAVADFLPLTFSDLWVYARVANAAGEVGNYILNLLGDGTASRQLYYGGGPTVPAACASSMTTWRRDGDGQVAVGDGGRLTLLSGPIFTPDLRIRLVDTIPFLGTSLAVDLVSPEPEHAWRLGVDGALYVSTGAVTDGTVGGQAVLGFLGLDVDRGPERIFQTPTFQGRAYDWVTFREASGRWGDLLEVQGPDGPIRAGFVVTPDGKAEVTDVWSPHRHGDRVAVSSENESYSFPVHRLLLHLPDFWWWDVVEPDGALWWEHSLGRRA